MADQYNILEDAVRDMFARAVWSHKIQEKQSDIYQMRYKWMETVSILCASLTAVGILSTIFTDQLWLKIVSAILSFATAFIAAYFKSFDLSTLTKSHKETANKLLIVRNEITSLLTSIKLKEKSIAPRAPAIAASAQPGQESRVTIETRKFEKYRHHRTR